MAHLAEFTLQFSSTDEATRVERSLRPEIGDIEGDRTAADLEREGDEITVTIEAEDLIALRAGINTWLTLADVAERSSGFDLG